jgi:1-phosphatidylinositol-3-phosphate 5-kinase
LIRIGVIDYIQQYTIDKIFESNFKKVLNAGENPTIIDPIQYRKRYKEAMDKYFVAMYSDKSI